MVPTRGPLSERLRGEIRDAVKAFMKEAEISQADLAKVLHSTATYVSNALSGEGNMPDEARDDLLRQMNTWLDKETRARDTRRPEGFVYTKVAERIIGVAERLSDRPDMALCYGPAGVGKSKTAEAVAAELGAVLVQTDDDCNTPHKLRRKLYNALVRKPRAGAVQMAELVEKLRPPPNVASVALVVIDDAQDLPEKCWVFLRKLHDQAQCSVLLLGTIDLRSRASSDDVLDKGQIASRVGMRINVAGEITDAVPGGKGRAGVGGERLFTVADIRELFGKGKLKLHPDTTRMLAAIANTHRGTLRRVERLVFWATRVALRRKSGLILPTHVENAAAAIIGEELRIDAPETVELQEATA